MILFLRNLRSTCSLYSAKIYIIISNGVCSIIIIKRCLKINCQPTLTAVEIVQPFLSLVCPITEQYFTSKSQCKRTSAPSLVLPQSWALVLPMETTFCVSHRKHRHKKNGKREKLSARTCWPAWPNPRHTLTKELPGRDSLISIMAENKTFRMLSFEDCIPSVLRLLLLCRYAPYSLLHFDATFSAHINAKARK